MSATCHPIPNNIAQDMVRGVADALCDRPAETPEHREALRRGVVCSVLSFQPRDPVEIMLAGMAVTNFQLILDSAHDALRGQLADLKGKTKSGVVALNRSVVGLMKEIRTAQTRAMEQGAEEARSEEPVEQAPECEPEPPTTEDPYETAPESAPVAETSTSGAAFTQAPPATLDAETGPNASPAVAEPIPPYPGEDAAGEDVADFLQALHALATTVANMPEPEPGHARTAAAMG